MGKKTTVFGLSSFSADTAVTGIQAKENVDVWFLFQ